MNRIQLTTAMHKSDNRGKIATERADIYVYSRMVIQIQIRVCTCIYNLLIWVFT
jgi:hypothetical protein